MLGHAYQFDVLFHDSVGKLERVSRSVELHFIIVKTANELLLHSPASVPTLGQEKKIHSFSGFLFPKSMRDALIFYGRDISCHAHPRYDT